jgi:dienelactone hydrolase
VVPGDDARRLARGTLRGRTDRRGRQCDDRSGRRYDDRRGRGRARHGDEDADGDALATATTTRNLPSSDTELLDDGLVGTVHYPDTDDSAPAVVVLHGSGGSEPTRTARLLASRGYVAASVQYFGDPDPLPDSLTEVPVEYIGETVRRLCANDRVADAPVGLQGASKGGELALLAGAHLEDVGAVVSVSGSGVAWEGLTERSRAAGTSSWTIDDEPVPYVEMPGSYPGSVREYYEVGLDEADADTRANATIPVERVDGPVALVSGRDDGLWNAARLQRIAADRRRDADETITHERYDDAGHSIRPPLQPTYGRSAGGRYEFGGTPAGNARAARSCWQLTLEAFERGLRN